MANCRLITLTIVGALLVLLAAGTQFNALAEPLELSILDPLRGIYAHKRVKTMMDKCEAYESVIISFADDDLGEDMLEIFQTILADDELTEGNEDSEIEGILNDLRKCVKILM